MSNFLRLVRIARVLVRYRLDKLLLSASGLPFARVLPYLFPWNWLPRRAPVRGVGIRLAIEDLGSIFVKFGQILSTRRDLLPPDIASELEKLQDQVPPFPGELAIATIERALREPLKNVFRRFETVPMASASIAQVHAAELYNGEQVVVKVVRPGIERAIRRDVALLYALAGCVNLLYRDARRFKSREVVAEVERTLILELNLLREAANASQIRRDFADTDMLYIPRVHWEYCHEQIMVMERIRGIPISDRPAMLAAGIDLKQVAEDGVEIFFRQVFQHNFFHADMHPGNIFVAPSGNYIAVDFGIVGSLTKQDQQYLLENFLAFFQRDYRAVADYHLRAGWIPADTRVDEFEAAIRMLCEPILDRPLLEISFAQSLARLIEVGRNFRMEVQPQLLLLQKTLFNIEGLGRQLYPQLDVWQTARPLLERWAKDNIGWRGFLKTSRAQLPRLAQTLPELPMLLHRLAEQAAAGTRGHGDEQLARLKEQLEKNRKTGKRALLAGFLLLASVLAALFSGPEAVALLTIPLPAWILGLLALYLSCTDPK